MARGVAGKDRVRKPRGRLLVLLGALVCGPLLAELGLRWTLFGESEAAQRLGANVRKPELYARLRGDERFWKLRLRFDSVLRNAYEQGGLQLDETFGWRSPMLVPPDYRHPLSDLLGERTPVVFYGASFVRPALMAKLHQGPLGDRFGLLTYGTNAWGMGQCWLLMQRTLGMFERREPVVLLGFHFESDLDRAGLGFRNAAKPRFWLDANGQAQHTSFQPAQAAEHIANHPIGIGSYVLAWLLGPQSPLPGVRADHERRVAADLDAALALHQELFRRMREAVTAIGGDFRLVIFHDSRALGPTATRDARELALLAFLEAEGIPYLDTRLLFEAAQRAGIGLEELYFPVSNPAGGHPTGVGLDWIVRALELLLQGHADRLENPTNPYEPLLDGLRSEADDRD